MERDPGAALVFPTGLLPPVDAAEDGNKTAGNLNNLVVRRKRVSPTTGLLPPADAAEDGNKTAGDLNNLVVRRKRVSPTTGLLPPADAAEGKKPEEGQRPSGTVWKKLREALLEQALGALPPPPDSRIRLAEGGDYDPYALDLFLYRRAVPPWDTVWESRPLVLHDRRLVETLEALMMFPWYLSDEPRDQVEAVTRVIGHHPGPVSSFRLHASLCPDTEVLGRWMDALSHKGVEEVVVFDLYSGIGDASMTRFPLDRLKTESLAILALGFFHLGADDLYSWSDGDGVSSSLVTLSLTGCSFSVSALSAAVYELACLRTLTVASCDLTLPGRYAIASEEDPRGLLIHSLSLDRLRFWKCACTKLRIEYAPRLRYLEVGIAHGASASGSRNVRQVSIVLREVAALRELHAVALRLHAIEIYGALGPAFQRKKRESLQNLNTLGIALNICMPVQAAALVDLLSRVPELSELTLSRVDDLPASGNDDISVSESWYLNPLPKWLMSTLQKLVISDYRGGIAEIALLTSLLRIAANLVSLSVHPKSSIVSPKKAIAAQMQALPRASKNCHISVVSANTSS